MPDPLHYESAQPNSPARNLSVSQIATWSVALIALSVGMSLFAVAWTRIIPDPIAVLAMVAVIAFAIALASAKLAHSVIVLLLHRFPNLPVPFSILPYLAAIMFAFILMSVCFLSFTISALLLLR